MSKPKVVKTTETTVQVKLGRIEYVSSELGAFVLPLQEGAEKVFISKDVMAAIKDTRSLNKGKLVQFEQMNDSVIKIEPFD